MVRKLGILGGLIAAAILLVAFAGTALAAPPTPGPGQNNYGYGLMDRVTLQRVATALKTTPEDITAQLQQGKTLAQIAQAKNVGEQALIDTLLQPIKDQLALNVKYGYMTQELADTHLKNQQDRIKQLVETVPGANGDDGYGSCHAAMGSYGAGMMGGAGGMMGGSGMMGGFGGMMGGFGGMMGNLGNMMGFGRTTSASPGGSGGMMGNWW